MLGHMIIILFYLTVWKISCPHILENSAPIFGKICFPGLGNICFIVPRLLPNIGTCKWKKRYIDPIKRNTASQCCPRYTLLVIAWNRYSMKHLKKLYYKKYTYMWWALCVWFRFLLTEAYIYYMEIKLKNLFLLQC